MGWGYIVSKRSAKRGQMPDTRAGPRKPDFKRGPVYIKIHMREGTVKPTNYSTTQQNLHTHISRNANWLVWKWWILLWLGLPVMKYYIFWKELYFALYHFERIIFLTEYLQFAEDNRYPQGQDNCTNFYTDHSFSVRRGSHSQLFRLEWDGIQL